MEGMKSENIRTKDMDDTDATGRTSPRGIIHKRKQKTSGMVRELKKLVAGISGATFEKELELYADFRKTLIDANVEDIVQAGVVPQLVIYLECGYYPRLQFEAAVGLTHITSGTSKHIKALIDHDAIPNFVKLLQSPVDYVREQAVWALGNVAGDSLPYRDLVLQEGALTPLLCLLNDEDTKLSMLRTATWTLSNFCRGKPYPSFDQVKQALPTLELLIRLNDEELLTGACEALSYLSDGTNGESQAVIEAGVCRRLLELLSHSSPCVLVPALRTVGNIVTEVDMQIQYLILRELSNLLTCDNDKLVKEACWVISKVTAGYEEEQIHSVIEAGIIGLLVYLLRNAEFDVKRMTALAICNATSGCSYDQILHLNDIGCLEVLWAFLSEADPRTRQVILASQFFTVSRTKENQKAVKISASLP